MLVFALLFVSEIVWQCLARLPDRLRNYVWVGLFVAFAPPISYLIFRKLIFPDYGPKSDREAP